MRSTTVHIDPGSPWQIPYGEGFNAVFRDGCLTHWLFSTPTEVQQVGDGWPDEYNNERPHGGLWVNEPPPVFERRGHPQLASWGWLKIKSLYVGLVALPWAGHNCSRIVSCRTESMVANMKHPFADLIGLRVDEQAPGRSTCSLVVTERVLNPHKVVHGAVLYALADTGMGAALYPLLAAGEICATIEIKINYFSPVFEGTLICRTRLVNQGKTIANLDAEIVSNDRLVARANGNYSIFTPKQRGTSTPT